MDVQSTVLRPATRVYYTYKTSRARGLGHVTSTWSRDHESVKCRGEQRDKGSGRLLRLSIGGESKHAVKLRVRLGLHCSPRVGYLTIGSSNHILGYR